MIDLYRKYYKTHTVGTLVLPDGEELKTLELPWKDNLVGESCIPEGQYIVERNTTGKHRWYGIPDVRNRTHIEFHPANKLSQLEGCIAPAMYIKNQYAYGSEDACKLMLQWFGDDDWVLNIKKEIDFKKSYNQ